MARPKYQIFISSTFKDLREEREAVIWALLSARHIPAGMENFTPTDDRGWKTILSVIDKSDYYVLILAGQYGTEDIDGLSWTEKEYNYAIQKGIPVLAFLRNKDHISASKFDIDPHTVAKRNTFYNKVTARHLCGQWNTKDDLVSLVTRAIDNQIRDDEDEGKGRPGWYRGNEIPKMETMEELTRLSKENSEIRDELQKMTGNAGPLFSGLSYDEMKSLLTKITVAYDDQDLTLFQIIKKEGHILTQRPIEIPVGANTKKGGLTSLTQHRILLKEISVNDPQYVSYRFTNDGHNFYLQMKLRNDA